MPFWLLSLDTIVKIKMIFSDRDLAKNLERTEAHSNVDFVRARAEISPESGACWIERAGAFAMFDGIESPLTQTFGLGVFDEVTNNDLDEIEAFFKQRNAPVLHEVSPMADASLFALLNERGYQPIEFSSVMFRELLVDYRLDAPINPKITTRIIEAGEEKLWAQTSAAGWVTEMPEHFDFMKEFGEIGARCAGAKNFLAEIENQPIAAGALFIYDGNALLAGASTVPENRRQGAQAALLDARLRFAVENGCQIAMMGASPGSQSQRNGEKNGFRIAYTRTKWKLKD